MLVVINYSDDRFKAARDYNSYTAVKYGKADSVIEYTPNNLPKEIKGKFPKWSVQNDRIIGRYGLWRPYIVLDALKKVKYGDYVCYSDAGLYFIDSIYLLIESMEKQKQDIMVFGLPFIEKQWTKRDVFVYLDADNPQVIDTNQIMSTIFIAKKTAYTISFFEKYKKIAENAPELFTDEENHLGEENYIEFIENRHNQSVLSVLAKKENLKVFRDPSEYGVKPKLYQYSVPNAIFKVGEYVKSDYPQIIVHHRSKKIRVDVKIFAWLRRYMPPYISVKLFKLGHFVKYAFKKEKWG